MNEQRGHVYSERTFMYTSLSRLRDGDGDSGGGKQMTIDLPFHTLCNLIHCVAPTKHKRNERYGKKDTRDADFITVFLLFYLESFNLLPFIKIQLKLK